MLLLCLFYCLLLFLRWHTWRCVLHNVKGMETAEENVNVGTGAAHPEMLMLVLVQHILKC